MIIVILAKNNPEEEEMLGRDKIITTMNERTDLNATLAVETTATPTFSSLGHETIATLTCMQKIKKMIEKNSLNVSVYLNHKYKTTQNPVAPAPEHHKTATKAKTTKDNHRPEMHNQKTRVAPQATPRARCHK